MKLTKTVLAVALGLTAMAISTSAFAATAEYADGTVTVKDATYAKEGQVAVAVVKKDMTEVSADDIYYINQADATSVGSILSAMGLKGAIADPENYEVRIGGEGMDMVKIDLTATTPTVPAEPTITQDEVKEITFGDTKTFGYGGDLTIPDGAQVTALNFVFTKGEVSSAAQNLEMPNVGTGTVEYGVNLINVPTDVNVADITCEVSVAE